MLYAMFLGLAGVAADLVRIDVTRESEAVFAAQNTKELALRAAHLRNDLSDSQQRELIVLLLRRIGSLKKCPFDPSTDKVDTTDKRHDLATETGRAAWALEQLLPCRLPVFDGDPANCDRLAKASYQRVIETLTLPAEMLPMNERVTVAASANAAKDVLSRLAKDPEIPVRRAVAENPRTTARALLPLWHDPDPGVSAAARQNLRRVRAHMDE